MNAYFHTSSIRSEGYMFFGAVFLAAFWIPIFAYYITNAIYKLRVVKAHEYIVYHAIVDKVDTFKIRIHNSGFHYKYDYCSCVGIKAKDVNKTRITPKITARFCFFISIPPIHFYAFCVILCIIMQAFNPIFIFFISVIHLTEAIIAPFF